MLATHVLAVWLAVWLTLTIGVAAGRTRWLCCTRETTCKLFTPIVMLATFGLGFMASDEHCGPRSAREVPQGHEWFTTIPSTLFAALTLQALAQLLVASTNMFAHQLMVSPCVAVHVCTALYYFAGETLSPSCVLHTRWGTEVRPLHYILWWVSMSAQLLTLNGLECALRRRAVNASATQAPSRGLTKAPPSAADTPLDEAERRALRRCALSLASIPTMLGLTLYVDVLRGPIVMHAVVFGAFYTALYTGIYSPLSACSMHALLLPTPTSRGLAFRFRAIAAYLLCAWHAFPLVWLIELLGGVSARGARIGYLVADLLAKFLPITLYISAAVELGA